MHFFLDSDALKTYKDEKNPIYKYEELGGFQNRKMAQNSPKYVHKIGN